MNRQRQSQPKHNPEYLEFTTLLWQAYQELENERSQFNDVEEQEIIFDLDGIPQHSLFDEVYDD